MTLSNSKSSSKWTFPVNYGKEHIIDSDVLIVGTGIAGSFAAISAAKKGAKVAAVDKSWIQISGSGGSGVDHWHLACTNPCCGVSPDEMIEIVNEYDYGLTPEFGMGPTCYVTCMEGWDALLEIEEMGGKIRDTNNEFAGAEFRDDKTKLMFAYDYDGRHCLRIFGAGFKKAYYRKMKQLGVDLHENIMITSLLTEGGKAGNRVVGATGVNVINGEFYVFRAKATVIPTGRVDSIWTYPSEHLFGTHSISGDPNTGGAYALAWRAGAEFIMMEGSQPLRPESWFPRYGTGNSHNTWYACTLVDSNGKEIPWVDRDGKLLKTVSERYHTVEGQNFFLFSAGYPFMPYKFRGPSMILDLHDRILKGEFVPPFYADLPGMPPHERRAIWGLMVGNEGKTLYPVYTNYSLAGFDPDRDMLEVNSLPPEAMISKNPAPARLGAQARSFGFVGGSGGLVFDWDFKTTLEGLYAAGEVLPGSTNYSASACTGRYAGRKSAEYALRADKCVIDQNQLKKEKDRVYSAIMKKNGVSWKEVRPGINRVMREYCPEYKNEKMLQLGLKWLNSISETEASLMYAKNPHDLQRTLECMDLITVGEMILNASLARKASSRALNFKRLDYPDTDPSEWHKYVSIRNKNGEIAFGELPLNYWLKPPFEATYRENYIKHSGL